MANNVRHGCLLLTGQTGLFLSFQGHRCLNNEVSHLLSHKIGSSHIGASCKGRENKLQFGSLPFVTLSI